MGTPTKGSTVLPFSPREGHALMKARSRWRKALGIPRQGLADPVYKFRQAVHALADPNQLHAKKLAFVLAEAFDGLAGIAARMPELDSRRTREYVGALDAALDRLWGELGLDGHVVHQIRHGQHERCSLCHAVGEVEGGPSGRVS